MANKLTSVLQSGTNNYLTPSLSFNRIATDLISSGIVGAMTNTAGVAPSTGSFAVNAQGSPNMTVAISSGTLYVSATPSGGTAQVFAVTSDASESVTIGANVSGSTKYDFVYLQLDATKLNTPAVNGLDVASFITQRSTTSNVDSNGAASNALLLAVVTVANSASSITNASIADSRVRVALTSSVVATTGQLRASNVTALGTTGTVSLDPTLGQVFTVTPTGAITLNAASAAAGSRVYLVVTTSGASSFNITPTTNFKSTGALATGTSSGKVFTLSFIGDGTNLNEIGRTAAM